MKRGQDSFWTAFSLEVYRAFFFALPGEFRRQHERDMLQVFRECCRDAHAQKGWIGILEELVGGVFDLLINSLKARFTAFVSDDRRMLVLLSICFVAVTGGVYAALADLRNDDFPGPTFLVVIFTFALGFLRPSSSLLTGLLVGSTLPVLRYLAISNVETGSYIADDSNWIIGLFFLIPAISGSAFGAIFRLLVNRLSTRLE